MLAAANDYPSILVNPSFSGGISKLVDAGKLYDLTELIPKYMPNLYKKWGKSLETRIKYSAQLGANNEVYNGKLYTIPMCITAQGLLDYDNTIDPKKFVYFMPPMDSRGYVFVRDDILKKLYPNAKTQKEFEDLYVQKGALTKEDMLDVSFKSEQEFFDFLYKVKDLNLKEANQPVYATYTWSGQDNWNLWAQFAPSFRGDSTLAGTTCYNYFAGWNKNKQTIEYTYKQSWFKDDLKKWNKLLRDGVVSKEAFIDPLAKFQEKMNNGLYAVLYGGVAGSVNQTLSKDKPYKYRKVYIDIPLNYEKYVFQQPVATSSPLETIAIFKDKVKEEDLPQLLRSLDFFASDIGEKLECWGPRSAGLWEEKNGKRIFKDKALEDELVNGKPSETARKYNLDVQTGLLPSMWSMPAVIGGVVSKYSPQYTYDRVRNPADMNFFFNYGFVEPIKRVSSFRNPAYIWQFSDQVPEIKRFWSARKSYEDALQKVQAASNDTEFEKAYSDFTSLAENIGLTDKTLEDLNKTLTDINKDYMGNLK
jgi:hypothetical protein